ncbi:hypothetical protein VB774_14790 [Pseudanabaena galeata UHCC 0370]|uniref:Uncharacterized protein n=1 Tax=Pseudanabaena galeata UHCC 0370 TaxID=3110310 RepID=A0ABU5TKU3_9CYAN|nr:hypothetical protein [Pseudanabaena galeata]MEA5478891.1 hypothetical protein [Pseudanabaena galeata UHCC 0370]
MSESIKATRATVAIGELTVDAFMLPDGSYRMSQAGAAAAIADAPVYALRFLKTNDSKLLLGEAFTDYSPDVIEVESEPDVRGQTRINALPLEVVAAYWLYRAFKGNKNAFILSGALIAESLECRFDDAFGVIRTEQERNETTTKKIKTLEKALANLGEGFASDDEIRRERDYFETLLKQNGIDPYELPNSDR